MAEGDGEASDLKDVLVRKVGPLPLWGWALIFVGVWYYIERKNSASSSTTSTTASGSSSAETDPLTGYAYGSAQDLADLQAQQEANSGSTSSTGTTTSATYTTNQAWEDAAINYLVGLGVDPTEANAAIAAYLSSSSLSTTQQAQVNEAISALGAPPQPPSPTTTGGGGIVTTPGSTVYATNPPTGLATTGITSTSISLKWNATTNATGYTVSYGPAGQTPQTLSTSQPYATISGLKAQTNYAISVQATPADTGAGTATVTASTSIGSTGTTGQPTGGGDQTLAPGEVINVPVNITGGKTMASVASQFGISLQHLIDNNPGSNASTTGVVYVPYLVKSGQTVTSIANQFGISPEHLEEILQQEGII